MLEEFLNHKLMINTKGATIEDLKELDKIINLPWASGQRLYEIYTDTSEDRFIMISTQGGRIVFSYISDLRERNENMPYVSYAEFIEEHKEINVSTEELENLFR